LGKVVFHLGEVFGVSMECKGRGKMNGQEKIRALEEGQPSQEEDTGECANCPKSGGQEERLPKKWMQKGYRGFCALVQKANKSAGRGWGGLEWILGKKFEAICKGF